MAAAATKGRVFWLQERKCSVLELPGPRTKNLEYPVATRSLRRYRPHDSRYLVAAGVRNRADSLRSQIAAANFWPHPRAEPLAGPRAYYTGRDADLRPVPVRADLRGRHAGVLR